LSKRRGWVGVCSVYAHACTAPTRSPRGVACVSAGGSAMASEVNERLCDAAGRGDVAEMERQIAAGADPNAFEGTGRFTPLRQAAMKGHVAAIAALLAAGAHVDGTSATGTTPLMWAAGGDRAAAIDALVAAGADVHRVNDGGFTALHCAVAKDRIAAARALLEAGARTDVRDGDGQRPIDMVRVQHSLVRLLC
jgi:hypothetical protein